MLSHLRRVWYSLSTLQWTVLLVLMGIALVSSLIATVVGNEKWDSLLLNFGTEMAGAVVTYILLQMLVGTRARKVDLIAQMGSNVRDVAIAAAEELKRHGWLTDGSLRETYLVGANLQGAGLQGADLQEAILAGANLQGAIPWEANLQGANLMGANLQRAFLWGTNLERADLRHTDLSTAYILDFVKLDGAKANSKTQWPEGFQVPDTVVMVED